MRVLGKDDVDRMKAAPEGSQFALFNKGGKVFTATTNKNGVTAVHRAGKNVETVNVKWSDLTAWWTNAAKRKVDRTAAPKNEVKA